MKQFKQQDLLHDHGYYICIYGEPKVGKTVSVLKYAPVPVTWLMCEPRALKPSIEVSERVLDKDLFVFMYSDFEDALNCLNNGGMAAIKASRTILFDGLSFMMASLLPDEMIEADEKKNSIRKQLEFSLPDRGLVNRGVMRILRLLGELTATGKNVVVSCLEGSNPKFDRTLTGAPLLTGNEVPKVFAGYFDYIGRLTPTRDLQTGVVSYPATVSFQEGNGYMAGYTGKGDRRVGPVDKFFGQFK